MRQKLIWSIITLPFLSLPATAQNQFVGVKVCARCHDAGGEGSAVHRWQTSRHAGAYRALITHSESKPRSCQDLELWIVEIGRGAKYGLPRPASESKECLPCHTAAFGAGSQLLAASFDPKDGVQCESCHGPGSAHVEARAANRIEPATAGFRRFEGERAIQARCQGCHEGTCGDFDFATAWSRIAHPSSHKP